jgi:rhamnosyltransferase
VQQPLTVGIAIITHAAKAHLPNCLPPLVNRGHRVVVVNSSSNDGTVELAIALGAEVLVIPRSEFNHGATREVARNHLATDIVVMMTPDAYLANDDAIERLIEPIRNGACAVTYGRQLPRSGADFFEAYLRSFNYPANSHVRSINDVATYGGYTTFCSDAFSAYLNAALSAVGGFEPTLVHEDIITVAKLLRVGYRVGYVAEAAVYHSHGSTLKGDFRRYFDTGYSRAKFSHVLSDTGSAQKLGLKFLGGLVRAMRSNPSVVPYAILHAAAKWFGFNLGAAAIGWPARLCAPFSAQDYYWSSKFFGIQQRESGPSVAARDIQPGS